jgi:hypothetical protein
MLSNTEARRKIGAECPLRSDLAQATIGTKSVRGYRTEAM